MNLLARFNDWLDRPPVLSPAEVQETLYPRAHRRVEVGPAVVHLHADGMVLAWGDDVGRTVTLNVGSDS